MSTEKPLVVIGNYETADLIDFGIENLPVKIDTGAYRSSVWVSDVEVNEDKTVTFCFFGPESEFYTGERITLPIRRLSIVKNSTGQKETRYVVGFKIRLAGKVIAGTFTLSNRVLLAYPMLVGRRLIYNRFLVDVTKGDPVVDFGKKSDELTRKFFK